MSKATPSELEILATGKYLRLVKKNGWEYTERAVGHGVVAVVAISGDKIILVEQYRPAVGCQVLELPAGLVGDHAGSEKEGLEIAARRELLEETGYTAGALEFLTEGPTTAGLSDEMVSFYFADQLTKTGPGGGDASENIKVHEVPLDSVQTWARDWAKRTRGTTDTKVFAGVYFAMTRKARITK